VLLSQSFSQSTGIFVVIPVCCNLLYPSEGTLLHCPSYPSQSSITFYCFAAFAFTSALCSHLPSSFSLAAVVLAIIYDIYSTFHVVVYIPTLIKQFVPGNSMDNHIVECIEAKINGA
jgi:hypothetical protein